MVIKAILFLPSLYELVKTDTRQSTARRGVNAMKCRHRTLRERTMWGPNQAWGSWRASPMDFAKGVIWEISRSWRGREGRMEYKYVCIGREAGQERHEGTVQVEGTA